MVLDPETVRRFISGMHDVALIEIVVIRCYFNNNVYSYGNDINKQSGTEHFFAFFEVIHQLAIHGY